MGRNEAKKTGRSKNSEHKNPDYVLEVYESIKKNRHEIDDVNKKLESSKYGYPTLLQLSIYKDDEEFMNYLLSRKDIDVNVATKVWGLALDLAVEQEKLPVVEKLLEAGTDLKQFVHKPQLKRTPLHNAIIEDDFDEDIANLLINHGASINDVCLQVHGSGPFTPIEVAVRFNINAFEFVLNQCVDIKRYYKCNNGSMPFLAYGHRVVVHAEADVGKIFESVFRRFIVIYHTANFEVGEVHLEAVKSDKTLDTLRRECQIEVQLMKRFLVDKTNINYYDLLHNSTQQLTLKLIHIDIDKKAMLATAGKLKNYKKMLTYKINKILYRVEMIKKYRLLVAKYFHVLPIEFIDIWVHYLNIPDLVNIAIALKKLT